MIKLVGYTPGDEAEIFNLISTVLDEYNLQTNSCSTDADIENIEKSYINNGGVFKVLKENGRIIGSYGIYKINNTTCELRKMYLYSKYKGHGLGKQMLDDALLEAKTVGFKTMILETNKVLYEARGLYRKYGFEEYKPEHLSDRCDIAMKIELGE